MQAPLQRQLDRPEVTVVCDYGVAPIHLVAALYKRPDELELIRWWREHRVCVAVELVVVGEVCDFVNLFGDGAAG